MKSAVDAVIGHLKTRNLDSRHILYISHADALDDAKKIMALNKTTACIVKANNKYMLLFLI